MRDLQNHSMETSVEKTGGVISQWRSATPPRNDTENPIGSSRRRTSSGKRSVEDRNGSALGPTHFRASKLVFRRESAYK